jgi:hypothetical protein
MSFFARINYSMLTILVTLNSINIFIDRSNIHRLCRSANSVRDRFEMVFFASDIFVILFMLGEPNMLYGR